MVMSRALSLRGAVAAAASLICFAAALWTQDSAGPSSLGDLARQTRAQHASEPTDDSGNAQKLVDEMQQEEEAAENAPTGFKSYNAGEYRLLVPFPFSLEGRDDGGAVLLGSRLGITNTEVLAGDPIPAPSDLSNTNLEFLGRQLASRFGQSPYCSSTKLGQHKVLRCGWNGSPLPAGPRSLGHDGVRGRIEQPDSGDVREPG